MSDTNGSIAQDQANQYRDAIVQALNNLGYPTQQSGYCYMVQVQDYKFRIILDANTALSTGRVYLEYVRYNNQFGSRSRDRRWFQYKVSPARAANIIVKELTARVEADKAEEKRTQKWTQDRAQSRQERDRVLAEVGAKRHKLVEVHARERPGTLQVEVLEGRTSRNTPMYCATESTAGFVTELSALLTKYNITTGYEPEPEEEE